jgi:hypothetical protein
VEGLEEALVAVVEVLGEASEVTEAIAAIEAGLAAEVGLAFKTAVVSAVGKVVMVAGLKALLVVRAVEVGTVVQMGMKTEEMVVVEAVEVATDENKVASPEATENLLVVEVIAKVVVVVVVADAMTTTARGNGTKSMTGTTIPGRDAGIDVEAVTSTHFDFEGINMVSPMVGWWVSDRSPFQTLLLLPRRIFQNEQGKYGLACWFPFVSTPFPNYKVVLRVSI